ncbi:sialate O-acetylesterase [Geofilum sp. OHC36d9]|uniref:sialate O-acetylesterase n=1 Tax=Geofilum sp. OHC36d9 TaxID=3458413 RepID=UPI0040336587
MFSIYRHLCLLFVFLWLFEVSPAQLYLPVLVSDHMVLQRNDSVNIWGWSKAGDKVSLDFRNRQYDSVADSSGRWCVGLTTGDAGGPYKMTIFSADSTIILNDILLGDVWLCSGQSNMELPIRRVLPLYKEEMSKAENAEIRYFEVPKTYNFKSAQKRLDGGRWQKVTPESVLSFSAVAYFFAAELNTKYKVPIGIINASLGGSPVEAWMSETSLKSFPPYYDEMQRFKSDSLIEVIEAENQSNRDDWYRQLNASDPGVLATPSWWSEAINDSDWSSYTVPGYWNIANEKAGNGSAWFRKIFEWPDSLLGSEAFLNLGRIIDADSVIINGCFIGSTSYQYPPRWYHIPKDVLKAGKNVIVVRIINENGSGGFVPDKPYEITAGNFSVNLTGEWHWKMGAVMAPAKPQTFIRWKPGGLFNAMIAPLVAYTIKGTLWYQGESNVGQANDYSQLFPTMITNWRSCWRQGDFPFLYVQLANLNKACAEPCESDLAQLREAQASALALPNTAMAVTYDIGEWNDIHPLNKKEVGHRLALAAQKVAYHEDVVYSGPQFESITVVGHKCTVSFSHAENGLKCEGKDLTGFAVAGRDGKWMWANAAIKGCKVEVWNDDVPDPVKVRYAWADNPQNARLFNVDGLPAIPFEAIIAPF